MPAPRRYALVAAVVVAAVGLRWWRLGWGLADREFFFDEWAFMHRTAKFLHPSWNAFWMDPGEYAYPMFYSYLSAALLVPAHALGLFGAHPMPDFLSGRIVATLSGLLTVWLVGVAAKRLYGAAAGFAAAALMAVTPLHVMHSHIATTDVTLTAGFVLTLVLSIALATRPTVGRALAAGAAAAVTFGTKYTGLAAGVSVAWALLEGRGVIRSRAAMLTLGAAVAVAFVVAFALACPPCAARPDLVLIACGWHQRTTTVPPFPNNRLTSTLGWYGHPYLYELVASLPFSLGWPLYALALIGVGLALWRHAWPDRLVLATIVPYFYVVGGAHAVFPRYLLPLLPMLVILAARALTTVVRSTAARAGLLAAVCLYSLVLSASQVARFSWSQQRQVAEWVTASVDPKARVAAPGWEIEYFHLRRAFRVAGRDLLVKADGEWLADDPDVVVVPDWYATAIRRDLMEPALPELERIESGAAGYRPVARFRSSYFQEGFYTWLDPAFASDLWQGEIGFTIYARAGGAIP